MPSEFHFAQSQAGYEGAIKVLRGETERLVCERCPPEIRPGRAARRFEKHLTKFINKTVPVSKSATGWQNAIQGIASRVDTVIHNLSGEVPELTAEGFYTNLWMECVETIKIQLTEVPDPGDYLDA